MAIGETSRPPKGNIGVAGTLDVAAALLDVTKASPDVGAAASVDVLPSDVDECVGAMTSAAGRPTMTGGGVFERRVKPQRRKGVGDQSFKTLLSRNKNKMDTD